MWHTMRYSMVFWGYPAHKAETILPGVVRLLDQSSGQRLIWHLENQPEILVPTSPDQWSAIVRKQRNVDHGSLSLFFDSPSRLSIGLTLDYPTYVRDFDVLSITLNADHILGTQTTFNFNQLYALFTECTKLFQPFWARLSDGELTKTHGIDKLYLSIDLTKVPDTVHWFNYFDEKMVERLGGKKKLLTAPVYEVREWQDSLGMLLILQREPFDFHNPEHRQKHEEIVQYIGLKQLHSLYPKKRKVHLEATQ